MLKLIDRYILKKFLGTFVFSITLILLIFIVFDIKDKVSAFVTNKIPIQEIITDYYLMFIPYYGNFFSPLFTFISVIFFTSKMANRTEFVAIFSSGTSFRRIIRPYLIGAFIIAGTSLVLNHFILPKATKIKIGFEDKWINKNYNSEANNLHIKIGPTTILYLESYDNKENKAIKVTIEEVLNNRQTYFLQAESMKWDKRKKQWKMLNGCERKITEQERLDTIQNQKPVFKQTNTFFTEKFVKIDFKPSDMWRNESKVEVMSYFELKKYIIREKLKGANQVELFEVEQYRRTSFPFATFILTIIGVSIASRKVRGGVGLQIALGLLLSCVYIMLMYIFNTIATTGFAPPLLAVWIPNIIFSIVALYFYKTAQQ